MSEPVSPFRSDKTVADQYRSLLDNNLAIIQGRLRRLADSIEIYRSDLKTTTSYTDLAAYVNNDILWALANMNLGGMISNAAKADLAREKESK